MEIEDIQSHRAQTWLGPHFLFRFGQIISREIQSATMHALAEQSLQALPHVQAHFGSTGCFDKIAHPRRAYDMDWSNIQRRCPMMFVRADTVTHVGKRQMTSC